MSDGSPGIDDDLVHGPAEERQSLLEESERSNDRAPFEDAPKSQKRALVGLAADTGLAGMRFGGAMMKGQGTVQANIYRKMQRALQRARDVELHDDWVEAVRRVTLDMDKAFVDFKDDSQELYHEAVEDILRRTDTKIDEWKQSFLEEYGASTGRVYGMGRICSDLMAQDYRKKQAFCMCFWVVFIVVWELVIAAIRHPLDCSHQDDVSLLQCYNVEDLLRTLNCSQYHCAVPWSADPGYDHCTHCNCGGICNQCTECLCTLGFGPSQHHVCRSFEYWPGAWATAVRWTVVACGAFVALLMLLKYCFAWYVEHRQGAILEADAENKARHLRKLRQLEQLRDELVGIHVEFCNRPKNVYHADLVRAAAAQRLEEQHGTYRHQESAARLTGEAIGAFIDTGTAHLGDLHNKVVAQELHRQELWASRPARKSAVKEAERQVRRERILGKTVSSFRTTLGDPWLQEVQTNGEEPPSSGQLFDLYKKASESTGGATLETLVKELSHAPGIHASLPFLKRFLLREPARNSLPISWPDFYAEVVLARDFIGQVARGGADIGKYLTSTNSGLWRNKPAGKRPSSATALLSIAQELAPLMGSEEAAEAPDLVQAAAGATPYVLPMLRSKPLPTRREARAQKKALLQALAAMRGLLSAGEEEEETEEDEEDTEDHSPYH